MDDTRSAGESVSFLKDLSLLLLAKARVECTSSSKWDELEKLILTENWTAICRFSITYDEWTCYESELIRQIVGLFQKFKFLPLVGVDRKASALQKWYEAESACAVTNELFQRFHAGACSFSAPVSAVYHRAQRKIARILGVAPKLSDLKFRFGKGANRSVRKQDASIAEKLGAHLTCSEDLYPYSKRILDEMPTWRDSMRNHENGGKIPVSLATGLLSFVPKDAFVDRGIDVPPSLNGLVQMGIGDYITRRMALFGLQISDQTVNQSYAEVGSVTGELSTIDLTSASDMISREIVRSLFPLDWWLLLEPACVRKTNIDGLIVEQHKFASMGNGFTFPIETLLFWSLASSVKDEGWASVYGDDIVVKTEDYDRTCEILEHAGFIPNRKKSFCSGPFRESCGKDFYRGTQIRPVYQKELIDGFELFRLHNFYYRKGWLDISRWIKRTIPGHLIIYGPDGYGDGHLLGPWKGVKKDVHVKHGYGGVLFDTYSKIGRRDKRFHRSGDRVLPQYSIYIRNDGERVYEVGPDTVKKCWFLLWHPLKYSSEPLGELGETGLKSLSLPGTCGYKRISIYTFAT